MQDARCIRRATRLMDFNLYDLYSVIRLKGLFFGVRRAWKAAQSRNGRGEILSGETDQYYVTGRLALC
jgi:hypothetical protein